MFSSKRLLLSLCLLLGLSVQADAAARLWNPYLVTGAVAGGGGGTECLLTISPAIVGNGLKTGDIMRVTGVGGATGCSTFNGPVTVQSTTTISLDGTTFGGLFTSGGCVAGGRITSANTANWAATSTATCGSGGQTVPGSADSVTFDANSLQSVVLLDVTGMTSSTWTLTSWVSSAFIGTLDLSSLNSGINNVTLTNTTTAFTDAGTGVHSIYMGNGTWTLSGAATAGNVLWNMTNTANITVSANSSALVFSGTQTNNGAAIRFGAKTYNTVQFTGAGRWSITNASATMASLSFVAGSNVAISTALTITITGAAQNSITWAGTRATPIAIGYDGVGGTTPIIVCNSSCTTVTLDWGILNNVTGQTGSFPATNTVSYGTNTGWTITGPSGGGGGIIGG